MSSKFEYNPPTSDPHIPDVRNCGCAACRECDALRAEIERLRAVLAKGRTLIDDMDLRMPEQATEDEDGWITSYRIPVGPWHRILGWARDAW